jgi:hypothetical protein
MVVFFTVATFTFDILGKIRGYLLFVILVLVSYLFSIGGFNFINKVLDKRGVEVENLNGVNEMYASRGQLAEPSILNFYQYPIFGIGFGVPSESTIKNFDYKNRWGITYFPGTKIIISYPVEKGVLYTMVLEELGIIGFVVFFFIVLRAISFRSYKLLLIVPILLLSLGEASLFSLGGVGIFGFTILSICVLNAKINWDLFIVKN